MKEIVIVGGGSAGWMTAAILIHDFPDKKITVIESPDIPRIGVGESTYEGINYYLEYIEVNRDDFFKYTDASVKLAIEFKDFYKESGHSNFIYPFGQADLEGTRWGIQDWYIKKMYDKTIPVSDFAESYFIGAHFVKHNTLPNENLNMTNSFNYINNTALHFDAIKFADWLKHNYCIPKGVKNILINVKDIKVSKNGIDYLLLENDEKKYADLFIDCTGFKSLLLSKTLDEPFISYNDVLPNTNAWATQIQYKNPKKEIENVTRCTALKNGWCWNIPLWSRLGAGYVYSNKFTSHEEALEEFKKYLKNDIKIKLSKKEIDLLSFKNIEMRVGIHERTWVKNVVAIGLSAGFIEPLESNGLFSVHEFLFHLVKALHRDEVSQWDIDSYNMAVKVEFDTFVEFIKSHYALSHRSDSDYWKNNFNTKYDFNKYKPVDFYKGAKQLMDLSAIKEFALMPDIGGGFAWVSAGMNYFLTDFVALKLGEIKNNVRYDVLLKENFKNIEDKKSIWNKVAQDSESSYEYLKRKYHSE